jgi:SCO1/SenC
MATMLTLARNQSAHQSESSSRPPDFKAKPRGEHATVLAKELLALQPAKDPTAHGFRQLAPRRGAGAVESIALHDHKGDTITFKEFFHGRPSIVVFFYTRCDNPMKCSLTVAKLGRVQKLLESCQLADEIQTAAITYDPAFDLPERLRIYGQDRGVRMDAHHRMLKRAVASHVAGHDVVIEIDGCDVLVVRGPKA